MHQFQVVLRINQKLDSAEFKEAKQVRRSGSGSGNGSGSGGGSSNGSHDFWPLPQVARSHSVRKYYLSCLTTCLQALDEVVEQHREQVNPTRNWKTATYQLVSLAALMGILLHFTRNDMKSD